LCSPKLRFSNLLYCSLCASIVKYAHRNPKPATRPTLCAPAACAESPPWPRSVASSSSSVTVRAARLACSLSSPRASSPRYAARRALRIARAHAPFTPLSRPLPARRFSAAGLRADRVRELCRRRRGGQQARGAGAVGYCWSGRLRPPAATVVPRLARHPRLLLHR